MSEKANSGNEVSSLLLTGKGNILFNKLKYATQLKSSSPGERKSSSLKV
jgi:hypothetical protein